MRAEVNQFIKACEKCGKGKVSRIKTIQPMIIRDTVTREFKKISLDFYGPLKNEKGE